MFVYVFLLFFRNWSDWILRSKCLGSSYFHPYSEIKLLFFSFFSFDSSFFGEMFTTEDTWFRYQEIQNYDFKHGLDIREYRHTILMFLLVCSGKLSEKSTKLQHL